MGMMITFSVAVSLTLVAGAAVAQQTTETINGGSAPAAAAPPPAMPLTGAAPEVGGPLISQSATGLDKVAPDGVSTKTVRAVPCSTAAHETDGTTTCIGITEGSAGAKNRH
jgi:hypothetical protein